MTYFGKAKTKLGQKPELTHTLMRIFGTILTTDVTK